MLVATAAPAVAASPLDDATLPGQTRYDRCLFLAQTKPQQAYRDARAWERGGGGAPARHCIAVALVGIRHYSKAAGMLDALARDGKLGNKADRAALYDQAGNAWLLALRAKAADASFTAALKLTPGDPDLLTDRARARAMAKNWSGADADLTAALKRRPDQPDLLVLRASALRALGKPKAARADVDKALKLKPNYDEALLERGTLRLDAGDKAGAESDWRDVIRVSPHSAAAAAAKRRIGELAASAPPKKN